MKVVGITSTAILSMLLGITVSAYAQHDGQGEKQDHSERQQGKHEQAKPEKQQHAQEPQHAQEHQRPEQNKQAHQAQQQDRNTEQQHAQQQQRTEQREQEQKAQHQMQQDRSKQQHEAEQQQDRNNQHQHAHHQQAQQQQRNNQPPQRSEEQQRIQQSAWRQHGSSHWDSDHRTWHQRGGYHGYRIPDDRFRGYFGPSHGFRIYGLPFLVVGGYPSFQYEGYWFSPVDPWPEYWGNDWYDNDDVYVNYADNGYYLYNRRYPNVAIAISISM
jgi:hypothetical protein